MSRARPRRVCYAGTYERHYSRNQLIIRALRDAGARVEEAHFAVFERRRDKSVLRDAALLGLAAQLTWAYARLAPSVALRLLRCDVLAVGYIGQLDMLVLAPLARLLGRRVVFNPLVTLTDTLVEDRQLVRPATLAARGIALLDRAALRLADAVLVDTQANREYLTQRFGVDPGRIFVVAVGAEDEFGPAATPTPPDSAPLDVLFIGKFIPLHGVETIVQAASVLRDRGVAARVELVGTGQTYARARALADSLGLTADTLVWTDWIPFVQLPARTRRADVALGIFGAGEKAGRVVPNKLYQSLACGVASITRWSAPVAAVLEDGVSALLVPPAEPRALADAIERLTDGGLRERMAAAGRAAFEAHASRAALAEQLLPALAMLANS
jgi:glycosyltransferase involved in cell wall biosynthesis